MNNKIQKLKTATVAACLMMAATTSQGAPSLKYSTSIPMASGHEGRAVAMEKLPDASGTTHAYVAGTYFLMKVAMDPSGGKPNPDNIIWEMKDEGFPYVANDMELDTEGNLYVTGYAQRDGRFAALIPATSGAYRDEPSDHSWDLFLMKLNPEGEILYHTYFGGSGHEMYPRLAVDSEGFVILTARAHSSDLQSTPGAFQEIEIGSTIVAKLNPDNGGFAPDESDLIFLTGVGKGQPGDVDVDDSGRILIVGTTSDPDFPVNSGTGNTLAGAQDTFVGSLAEDGSSAVLRFFGGAQDEWGLGIAAGTKGQFYITGKTSSWDLPISAKAVSTHLSGPSDAFVAEFQMFGNGMGYATYLGGAAQEFIQLEALQSQDLPAAHAGIEVMSDGDVVVSGWTASGSFPTKQAVQSSLKGEIDSFLTRIRPDENWGGAGSENLIFSTFFGGNSWDVSWEVSVNELGEAAFAGSSASEDYPTTFGAIALKPAGETPVLTSIQLEEQAPGGLSGLVIKPIEDLLQGPRPGRGWTRR